MTNVYDKEYERTLKRSIKRKYGHCMKDLEICAYGSSIQWLNMSWVDARIKIKGWIDFIFTMMKFIKMKKPECKNSGFIMFHVKH